MEPTTAEDWIAVANERGSDAEAIKKDKPTSVGSVYMAGYAIECSLKALLQKRGIPLPTYGRSGHNLKELWKASGLKISDLKDNTGTKTFFLEEWETALRYECSLPTSLGLGAEELVEGAKKLNRWIQKQVRGNKPGRRQ